MAITLELPPDIERQLQEEWNGEMSSKILEAVAIEGYRQGTLSRGQVSELLGPSFQETEVLLKARDAQPPFTLEDIAGTSSALESCLKY